MKAKKILMQYRGKLQKVDDILEEYERYKTRAEKMTSIISETSSRGNTTSDKVGQYAVLMADLSKEWEKRWYEAERERLRILDTINELDEPYRQLLFLRYIRCLDMARVAENMCYSLDRVNHLHGTALKEYERRIEQWH